MATFLFTWELGGGLGHVMPFRPVAERLIGKGHRVVAALRELTHAERAFGDLPVEYLPAPFKSWRTEDRIDPLLTFAHILHNTGWSSVNDLRTLMNAWRTIFDLIKPDVVICDHSPTALLALRGRGTKYVTFGTGFFAPPDETPLPLFRMMATNDLEKVRQVETKVLQNANELLAKNGQPILNRVTELYADADEEVLTTFAELDHFPHRTDGYYVGRCPTEKGRPVIWPPGNGPKVFAYLKDFPAIVEVVKFLSEQRWPSVVVAPGLWLKLQPFAAPTILLAETPFDLQQVAREANLIIGNGNNGTVIEVLLSGKPVLSIPVTLDHSLFADRVSQLGAGMTVAGNKPTDITQAMIHMLQTDRYAQAAQRFEEKYASFNPAAALDEVVGRLERMAVK